MRNDTEMLEKYYIEAMQRDQVPKAQVKYFHAKIIDKDSVSKWWFERENSAKILFAATDFGEGIHHESVEFVIHYRKCYSIIDYFQQIGRAARGNKLIGKCLFLLDTVESKIA
jgi:superfamily II DNA helicase RecQ